MKKDYEIALSYAHKDEEVASILKEELYNVFVDKFFMDGIKKEELANADIFKEKLRNIFQRSHYSIILFSKNYDEGTFTKVEQEVITKKAPYFFIININNYTIPDGPLQKRAYIELNVNAIETDITSPESENQIIDWNNVRTQIYDIIHNQIIKFMIKQSIVKKKQQGEYSFNIQTLFANGNLADWKMDYDWNLIGSTFVGEDGRKIKEDAKFEERKDGKIISIKTGWDALWKYIENEFCYIKMNLNEKPNIVRKIRFNCHLSIAFKLGQIYGDLGQASGNRNLVLLSSNKVSDTVFTLEKKLSNGTIEDFCQEYTGNNCNSADIVCIISIKPQEQANILETVRASLKEQGQEYCKIYLFQKKITITTATNLEIIAEYLRNKMEKYRPKNKCKIHLFPDTTAPLMFVLAARSIFHGEIQLYEYNSKKDSYEKSLTN